MFIIYFAALDMGNLNTIASKTMRMQRVPLIGESVAIEEVGDFVKVHNVISNPTQGGRYEWHFYVELLFPHDQAHQMLKSKTWEKH